MSTVVDNNLIELHRPDTDASYAADKAALQTAIPGYESQVYAITVGSETLYRGSLTGATLLEKIQDMQSAFPNMLIGTADSWNKYADGTADALVTGGVKLLMVNAFAYWQAQDISNASATYFDDTQQAIGRIQDLAGSTDAIEIWTGETGWPTGKLFTYISRPSWEGADNIYRWR